MTSHQLRSTDPDDTNPKMIKEQRTHWSLTLPKWVLGLFLAFWPIMGILGTTWFSYQMKEQKVVTVPVMQVETDKLRTQIVGQGNIIKFEMGNNHKQTLSELDHLRELMGLLNKQNNDRASRASKGGYIKGTN